MKTILNYTGHRVVIGEKIIPADGIIRLPFSSQLSEYFEGIPIYKTKYGRANLPEKEENTVIIVSKLVCEEHTERDDLYMVVNCIVEDRKVVGCEGLCRNPFYREPQANVGIKA